MDKSGCKKIIAHLLGTKEDGSDVIGVYPLLSNGTCRFIVFDFDNHEKGAEVTDFANTDNEWHKEVDALRKMCELNGIRPLVERSRSGKGVHVWIFFKKLIPAATARNFGFLLLDKGSTSINLKSFHYYDRMYPSQDVAKVLYGILLDRKCLSDSNGDAWRDEYGITYIIFTIEEIMNLMNLGNKKVNKMLIELEPHGLIYRRHQGLGKPNKMYYEDAKENAAFERCTDVITNMIIKYGPLLKRKWAVEEWLRNIHVGCFWKELAVKRYGRYVENMKKWKFGLEKSTA